jgi:hypothetical protein
MTCWSGSSLVGCILIRVTKTLSIMSDGLSLQSSRSMLGVLFEKLVMDMVMIILSL